MKIKKILMLVLYIQLVSMIGFGYFAKREELGVYKVSKRDLCQADPRSCALRSIFDIEQTDSRGINQVDLGAVKEDNMMFDEVLHGDFGPHNQDVDRKMEKSPDQLRKVGKSISYQNTNASVAVTELIAFWPFPPEPPRQNPYDDYYDRRYQEQRPRPDRRPDRRPGRPIIHREICIGKDLEFLDAVQRGDTFNVRSMLNHTQLFGNSFGKAININCQKQDGGWSALMIAAYNNYWMIVDSLLEYKANKSLTHDSGATALSFAFEKNADQAAESLLRAGANPREGYGGRTALEEARKQNNFMMKVLLERYGYKI